MMNWLKGKKTYIVAIAAAVVVGLRLAGVIDADTARQVLELLGVGAIVTIRHAIANGGPAIPPHPGM